MEAEEFVYRGKIRRRKRKSDGSAFDGELSDKLEALQPLKDSGLYCKSCGKWQRWKELAIVMDSFKEGPPWIRRWFCKCGNQLKEEEVG